MKLNMFFLAAVLAATLHCSLAQRTHVVGDSLGWTFPPAGSVAYTTWASTQSFTVGDILVFNFPTRGHDVAEVNRASFDSCNPTNPISLTTDGPANITLTTAGEHYYICTFSGHCASGQKLAINVSAAPSTSPPPRPATPPPPAATPEPTPSPVPATSPAPSPSSPAPAPSSPGATPPSSSTTPPPSSSATPPPSGSATPPPSPTTPSPPSTAGDSAPPPPNSAPSFAGAALPISFLAIALAFFY